MKWPPPWGFKPCTSCSAILKCEDVVDSFGHILNIREENSFQLSGFLKQGNSLCSIWVRCWPWNSLFSIYWRALASRTQSRPWHCCNAQKNGRKHWQNVLPTSGLSFTCNKKTRPGAVSPLWKRRMSAPCVGLDSSSMATPQELPPKLTLTQWIAMHLETTRKRTHRLSVLSLDLKKKWELSPETWVTSWNN